MKYRVNLSAYISEVTLDDKGKKITEEIIQYKDNDGQYFIIEEGKIYVITSPEGHQGVLGTDDGFEMLTYNEVLEILQEAK